MKVSFGIVNCNRLHYLRSCVESLLICTDDYPNKEIIVIDNASIEPGTKEYLEELTSRGVKVHKTEVRNPTNEYAIALNKIVELSTGEIICPLSGDLQFVVQGGWVKQYVELMSKLPNVGSIMLDSQRRITNEREVRVDCVNIGTLKFWKNLSRPPIATSGNSFYRKNVLLELGPWSEDNKNHEGSGDSETKMLQRVMNVVEKQTTKWCQYQPNVPMTVMIYTDPRGTNARIRGDKIYGKYYAANGSPPLYYKIRTLEDLDLEFSLKNKQNPIEIEKMAVGNGWNIFLDSQGNWKKNPVRVENCSDDDWVFIDPEKEKLRKQSKNTKNYLSDWLDD